MKKIIVSFLMTIGLSTNVLAVEGNAAAGKDKSAMCVACHGVDGNSLVPMYPKLADLSANYIVKQLTQFKDGTRQDPIMAGMVAALSEQDMADLAAYFSAQQRTASAGSATELGKNLYFGGNAENGVTACVACHGIKGKGMAAAGFPSIASQNAEYIKIQLEKFRSGVRANDNNGMMRNVVLPLTDDEIVALSQFIASLK